MTSASRCDRGSWLGFLGPNGAGKTTTMRIILGLAAPTAGAALVGGRHYRQTLRPLWQVGSLIDPTAVYGGRTAHDHLLWVALSNGIGHARVTQMLELVGLGAVATQRVGGNTLGMKQRLAALQFTSEYSSGLIRTTFAAVPQRWTVLAGKAAVVGAAALVIGEVLAFGCFALVQAILSGRHRGGVPRPARRPRGCARGRIRPVRLRAHGARPGRDHPARRGRDHRRAGGHLPGGQACAFSCRHPGRPTSAGSPWPSPPPR